MTAKRGNPPIPIGRIKIRNDDGRGWEETYNLKGASYPAAHIFFAPIINYRNAVLGGGLTVEDWSISDSNADNDGYKSDAGVDLSEFPFVGEVGPPIAFQPCQNCETAIKVRFATGNATPTITLTGKSLTYRFRGVRDDWVTRFRVNQAYVGMIDTTFTPVALSSGMLATDAWFTFLYYVMVGCTRVHTSPPLVPGGDPSNEVLSFVRAYARPIAVNVKTGRDPTAGKGRIRRNAI